jgi:hypothetical protein
VKAGARAGWMLAAGAVVAGSLLLHLPVSDLFDGLARRYGFTEYDTATRAVFALAGLGVLGWLWSGAGPQRPAVLRTTVALGLVIALGQAFIVVNGIEAIHYPQYALLAWVLVRAGSGLERAWLTSMTLGGVDEVWQWQTLPRAVPGYLDWNDIVLNAIGAALGVLLVVRAGRVASAGPAVSRAVVGRAVGVAAIAALLAGPVVELPFYRMTPGGRPFHLLSPFSAVVVLAAIWMTVRDVTASGQPRSGAGP